MIARPCQAAETWVKGACGFLRWSSAAPAVPRSFGGRRRRGGGGHFPV